MKRARSPGEVPILLAISDETRYLIGGLDETQEAALLETSGSRWQSGDTPPDVGGKSMGSFCEFLLSDNRAVKTTDDAVRGKPVRVVFWYYTEHDMTLEDILADAEME